MMPPDLAARSYTYGRLFVVCNGYDQQYKEVLLQDDNKEWYTCPLWDKEDEFEDVLI